MKNKIGFSLITAGLLFASCSSAFASDMSKAEEILNTISKTKFECSKLECFSKDISIINDDTKIEIGNFLISFNNNVQIKFDISHAKRQQEIIVNSCNSNLSCIEKGTRDIYNDGLSEILSQTKRIELNNIKTLTKKTNLKTTIKKASINIDKNLLSFGTKELNNLTIQDLIFNANINIEGIQTEETNNMLKHIVKLLPKSKSFELTNGQYLEVDKPYIKDINFKLIKMYSTLIKKVTIEAISNINIKLKSEVKGNTLHIYTTANINDSIYGNNKVGASFKFKDAIKNINNLNGMKENKMMLLSILGTNLLLDTVYIDSKSDYFFNIHKELLENDSEYKNDHQVLLSVIKEHKEKLSFYQNFEYKLLSLEFKEGKVSVRNKNGLQAMELLMGKDNKDIFEIEESFK